MEPSVTLPSLFEEASAGRMSITEISGSTLSRGPSVALTFSSLEGNDRITFNGRQVYTRTAS